MEFSARKRSRKSQSFKVVSRGDDHHEVYKISEFSHDVNGQAKETQPIFIEDESMEIKKQVTGMRRLLNDSAGRRYQRVGKEGEKLKEEPQDPESVWPLRLNNSVETSPTLHPPSRGAWNELPPHSGQFSEQYGTRSRTFQTQSHSAGSPNALTNSADCRIQVKRPRRLDMARTLSAREDPSLSQNLKLDLVSPMRETVTAILGATGRSYLSPQRSLQHRSESIHEGRD